MRSLLLFSLVFSVSSVSSVVNGSFHGPEQHGRLESTSLLLPSAPPAVCAFWCVRKSHAVL